MAMRQAATVTLGVWWTRGGHVMVGGCWAWWRTCDGYVVGVFNMVDVWRICGARLG